MLLHDPAGYPAATARRLCGATTTAHACIGTARPRRSTYCQQASWVQEANLVTTWLTCISSPRGQTLLPNEKTCMQIVRRSSMRHAHGTTACTLDGANARRQPACMHTALHAALGMGTGMLCLLARVPLANPTRGCGHATKNAPPQNPNESAGPACWQHACPFQRARLSKGHACHAMALLHYCTTVPTLEPTRVVGNCVKDGRTKPNPVWPNQTASYQTAFLALAPATPRSLAPWLARCCCSARNAAAPREKKNAGPSKSPHEPANERTHKPCCMPAGQRATPASSRDRPKPPYSGVCPAAAPRSSMAGPTPRRGALFVAATRFAARPSPATKSTQPSAQQLHMGAAWRHGAP